MEPDTDQKSLTVTLPFELLSYIVDLNSDDKATLYHIALTNKALCADAIKHLYASSPILLLKWADPKATSGMKFLSTIHNSTEYALLVKKVTIGIPHNCNSISVRVVVTELKKMSNITSLSVAPFYGNDTVSPVTFPEILMFTKCPYKLKSLTWRGWRGRQSLSYLCILLESHRDTLEMVDIGLDYYGVNPPLTVAMQNSVIGAVRGLRQELSIDSRSDTESSDNTSEPPPLPILHTFTGSLEVLDIFLPSIASPSSISNLVISPPSPSVQVSKVFPKHPPRILDFLRHSSLTSLTVDISSGWEFDLEPIMLSVPSLETLAIHSLKSESMTRSYRIRLLSSPRYNGSDLSSFQ
ncbi:hypothetical protein CVT24_011183 [Panaeolus cyanescens]|uniref:Uncharacterized protein n=1 Tax=Panaeolus cyanescens TaxID=181874 RepID=A0A409YGD4_9AGAR|nr:hypothetical protein CVT24_011183 [Panaeolus cyanescens]